MKPYILGIDTSNYKTSIAIVDADGRILANEREFLQVRPGERGLRQSEAVFQHVNALPTLCERAYGHLSEEERTAISAIAVSTKPRPVEGSYMPCFQAGLSAAQMMAQALQVPLYTFSHQEGHIAAVRQGTPLEGCSRFISFHFSGGTTEAILVQEGDDETHYDIVGGTRDLAYGQWLDRIGVATGMAFPAGQEMDEIALTQSNPSISLPRIKVKEGFVHLSGIETHCQRILPSTDPKELIGAIFQEMTRSIGAMCMDIYKRHNVNQFLFAGGVTASQYVREHLADYVAPELTIQFGDSALSSDNAVGIAYLGVKQYGIETNYGNTSQSIH